MKLLMCQLCGDIIAPWREREKPRFCRCQRHAVWWFDPDRGVLCVHDTEGPTMAGPAPQNRYCWILGINNAFLEWPGRHDADAIRQIDEACPVNYLFRRIHSPIVRFRPGETSDGSWAPLPTGTS